ncbi:hypothetical protein [Christiangramia sp. SM2212]|uniref:Uncharacterized protein n=1 Tax=Christiangramia sediminicola TaxID=3073267 RepID=A0ABU1ELT2_9FLAO|nr:hypothetical protein [Christiangramia sp. SM2212]MDR5589342.1 hypothetical protein [Christiangramia sp. SM2212]
MVDFVFKKGLHPHFIKDDNLILSKGNTVFENKIAEDLIVAVGKYNSGIIQKFLALTEFGNRIGRLGFHSIQPFNDGLLGIQKGNIVFKKNHSRNFENVFSGFRGSRPLNVFADNKENWACFGEYFGNDKRDEVHVYDSVDGVSWNKCYTFPKEAIRHVHGIFADPYRKGYWCLTGDSDSESGLWFTSDRFKTLKKVLSGSQKARAVQIIPTKEGIIVPMDSPLERNYIHYIDLEDKIFTKLKSLPGSAFHATLSNNIYFVTTVTEPSDVNITDSAYVFASLNGVDWKCISVFKKDFIPIKYQGITRYTEVSITPGSNNSDYIFGYARSVKGGSGLIQWKKSEIIEFLSNSRF